MILTDSEKHELNELQQIYNNIVDNGLYLISRPDNEIGSLATRMFVLEEKKHMTNAFNQYWTIES